MSTIQCESNLTSQQQQQGLPPSQQQQQPNHQQLNTQPMQSTQTPTPQPNAPLITTGKCYDQSYFTLKFLFVI